MLGQCNYGGIILLSACIPLVKIPNVWLFVWLPSDVDGRVRCLWNPGQQKRDFMFTQHYTQLNLKTRSDQSSAEPWSAKKKKKTNGDFVFTQPYAQLNLKTQRSDQPSQGYWVYDLIVTRAPTDVIYLRFNRCVLCDL